MHSVNNRNRLTHARVKPIVVPLWLGAERRGPDLGAEALYRELCLQQHARVRDQRLEEATVLDVDVPDDADRHIDGRDLAFREPILDVAMHHAHAVEDAIRNDRLALTIGGDHAIAFGSLTGAARASERVGVIWLDTHPDLNTPDTSPSGHMHGLPLATAIGVDGRALTELEDGVGRTPMIDPGDVVLLGVRDIDASERNQIDECGIWTMTMESWHDAGIADGLGQALRYLEGRDITAVHVSLDVDVLDPTVMPGTGTKMPGGLTFREASQVLRRLGDWDAPIASLDIAELNPLLDVSGGSTRVASLLLATALGARMLPPTRN
jgi:arginase